ncbi:MAG: hypothetical protein NT040_05480 [Bacteroidetes bacterium]|nr:hypothetical protein [Bacteroidota bacterium]
MKNLQIYDRGFSMAPYRFRLITDSGDLFLFNGRPFSQNYKYVGKIIVLDVDKYIRGCCPIEYFALSQEARFFVNLINRVTSASVRN